MDIQMIRLLRTPYSERFMLQTAKTDFAVLELHYVAAGKVSATLILFENGPVKEAQVPELLTQLDEILLPDVSIQEGSLTFSVVVGRVLGDFTAHAPVAGGVNG